MVPVRVHANKGTRVKARLELAESVTLSKTGGPRAISPLGTYPEGTVIGRSKPRTIGKVGETVLRIKLNPIGKKLLRRVGEVSTRVGITTDKKFRLLRSLVALARR